MGESDDFTRFQDSLIEGIANIVLRGVKEQSLLYHYTNAESLVSIIRSSELWVSNCQFMNDVREVDFADRIFKETVQLLNERGLSTTGFIESFNAAREEIVRNAYVLSLSKSKDSLNLWNNYGKNEGYCIGFKFKDLLDFTNNNLKLIGPKAQTEVIQIFGNILYDIEDQKEFVRYCATKYLELLSIPIGSNTDEYIAKSKRQFVLMICHSYLLKQQEHSVEDEFRIVFFFREEDEVSDYRTKNGVIVPVVKLRSETGLLPISEVTVGPKIDDAVAEIGLVHLLHEKYRGIKPKKSRIKLRF